MVLVEMPNSLNVRFGSVAAAQNLPKKPFERPVCDRHQTVTVFVLYVSLLRQFQCIVDFDAQVPDSAVQF